MNLLQKIRRINLLSRGESRIIHGTHKKVVRAMRVWLARWAHTADPIIRCKSLSVEFIRMQRSLVAHMPWEHRAAGSNPVIRTYKTPQPIMFLYTPAISCLQFNWQNTHRKVRDVGSNPKYGVQLFSDRYSKIVLQTRW